jgi:hypothetical protein
MVDIETMGTNVNAPIVQIGAVYFSLETGDTGDEFFININLEDSLMHQATCDGQSIYWWLTQDKEARDGLQDLATPFLPEKEGLSKFNQFWAGARKVWSHATFDFVRLIHSMRRRDIQPTVHYRKAMDIRTLTFLSGPTAGSEREGILHNALDDALYQVKYCHEAYKNLRGLTNV